MTPDALATLHAACFTRPRPWSPAEFAGLLTSPATRLFQSPDGFLLARIIADEAELLTLAVSPTARRTGQGATLVLRFLADAAAAGAETAFLEVAADNVPAISLYRRTGWTEAGRRRNYYAPGVDALVLRRDLRV